MLLKKRDLLFPSDIKINEHSVALTVFASYKVSLSLFSLVLTYCDYKHISKKTSLYFRSELNSFSKCVLARYKPNFPAEGEGWDSATACKGLCELWYMMYLFS